MVVQFRGVFDARVILMSVELSVCACPGGFGAVVHNSTRQPAGYERTQGPPSTYSLVLIWGGDDVDNGWVSFCQTVENIPYSSWNFGSSFSFWLLSFYPCHSQYKVMTLSYRLPVLLFVINHCIAALGKDNSSELHIQYFTVPQHPAEQDNWIHRPTTH